MPPLPAQLTFQNEGKLGPVIVDLWDARTGSLLRRLTGPQLTPLIPGVKQFAPLAVTFSFNSRVVALAGANTEVWAWATRNGAPVQPLQVPDKQFAVSLAFSPNDRMIAAGTASGAYVWNLSTTSAPLPEFKHADPSQFSLLTGGAVYLGFTRDSRILATVGDLALKAWLVADHLQLFDAFAGRGSVNYDGTQLVAAAGNRLSLYPCDLCGGLPQLMAVAKRQVTRGLTPQERATYLRSG
jgi:WD40 repeat protein